MLISWATHLPTLSCQKPQASARRRADTTQKPKANSFLSCHTWSSWLTFITWFGKKKRRWKPLLEAFFILEGRLWQHGCPLLPSPAQGAAGMIWWHELKRTWRSHWGKNTAQRCWICRSHYQCWGRRDGCTAQGGQRMEQSRYWGKHIKWLGKQGSVQALCQFLTGLLIESNMPSLSYTCTHSFFRATLGTAWQDLGLQRALNSFHLSFLISMVPSRDVVGLIGKGKSFSCDFIQVTAQDRQYKSKVERDNLWKE